MDLVYTNIKKAFRAAPCPHLGTSDHLSVMLIPAYKTLLTKGKPTWDMFREAATGREHMNLEE